MAGIKIKCGGFYIDNATLKLMPDGKTMYVAANGNGGMTQENGDERYILKDSGDGYASVDALHVYGDCRVQDLFVRDTANMNNQRIQNVGDPIDDFDAVTRHWIENNVNGVAQASVTSLGTVKAAEFVSPNDINNDNAVAMLQLLVTKLSESGVLIET